MHLPLVVVTIWSLVDFKEGWVLMFRGLTVFYCFYVFQSQTLYVMYELRTNHFAYDFLYDFETYVNFHFVKLFDV